MRSAPWLASALLLAACSAAPQASSTAPAVTASPAIARPVAVAAVKPPAGARVLWVDPKRGRDSAAGTRSTPLRSVAEAWERIPQQQMLTRPTWVMLRKGVYPQTNTPHYWEHRWGTPSAPIVLQAADRIRSAVFRGDINAFDVRHLTLRGIAIDRAGDAFHCERCSYVSLRNTRMNGRGAAHETIKVNQSDHITIDRSDISGSYENAIDFVAVQYATISNNNIHHADDWCAYVKGGSAYVTVRDNRIHDCGTGGFTAGQGTGFEYMVSPWLRYETYGVSVIGNRIWNTEGAGLGVNGGYNTVMAHNTLYRVGERSHVVEFVHGSRSCDGDIAGCQANRSRGGWGGPGIDGQFIPNSHTYFVNNVIVNPDGYRSQWQQIQLAEPVDPPPGSGVPSPSRADTDLVVAGNVFSNGGPDMSTGLSGATEQRFLRDNQVNTLVPQFADASAGDFRPRGPLASLRGVALPAMTWADIDVPAGSVPVLPNGQPPGALRP